MATRGSWLPAVVMVIGCGRADPDLGEHAAPLSPSAELDLAPTTLGPAPSFQRINAIVPRSGGYAAVWTDGREQFGQITSDTRVYVTRIAGDGTVLDPTGIPIGPLVPAFESQPGVAAACNDADLCLFVATGGTQSQTILGVRIAGSQVLDVTPKLLLDAGTPVEQVSLAWNGAAFRVTWRSVIADQIWTASIAVDGTLGTPVLVADTAHISSIACQRPACLITYNKGPGVVATLSGRLVDSTGALGPEHALFDPPGREFSTSLFWDGRQYWLGLTINRSTINNQFGADIAVQRIAADGSVPDLAGITIAPGAALISPFPPAIGHDGTHALVIWGQQDVNGVRAVRIARITDTGTVVDPGGVPFPAYPIQIDIVSGALKLGIACRPGECLAAWTQTSISDERVRGTRLAGITELSPGGFDIATSPPGTTAAAATFGLGHYLAVWRDSRDSSQDPRLAAIRGAVFSPSMTPIATIDLGPSPMPPQNAPCPDQDQPTVAASASSYMVVWHGACTFDNNLYGQALDGNGQPTAPAFIVDASSGNETHPSIASSGSGFLVVWDNTAAPIEIQGRRFDATGAPLGAAFTITPSGLIPVVAFDGVNYLAVWRRTNAGQRDLFAAHVTPAGAVLPPEITIAQTTAGEEGESVACGGGTCLVAWRGAQIRAARVSRDGSVLDPGGIVLATATGSVFATSVAWDGAVFVVTWRTANELRAARIAPNGTVLATTHATIAAPPTAPERPALVSNGAGHLVAFYDRFDPTSAFRVRRVRAVAIGDDDPAPPVDAGVPDAAVPVPDAAVPVPDAAVPVPDAAVPVPDAAVPVPDAAVPVPDAAVPVPDAAVPVPDAAVPVPDAAVPVPDAAVPVPDAAVPVLDARSLPDAGTHASGGGCDARHGDASLLAWLVGLVALRRRYRRGAA